MQRRVGQATGRWAFCDKGLWSGNQLGCNSQGLPDGKWLYIYLERSGLKTGLNSLSILGAGRLGSFFWELLDWMCWERENAHVCICALCVCACVCSLCVSVYFVWLHYATIIREFSQDRKIGFFSCTWAVMVAINGFRKGYSLNTDAGTTLTQTQWGGNEWEEREPGKEGSSIGQKSNILAFCVYTHAGITTSIFLSMNAGGEGEGPMGRQKDILILTCTHLTQHII